MLILLLMSLANINLLTWNITGIMSSAAYLSDILVQGGIDICGVSEHWLMTGNVHFMDSIHCDYRHYTVCDKPGLQKVKTGRGGVTILWHKRFNNIIMPLDIDDNRVVGIQIQLMPGKYVYVFQVYLPCRNHSVILRVY
jgi:exonuclease III